MKKLQKGFTLIELLIVIMIIGILSASMALVSNKSTASAKAANIISNLKIMQSAGSLFYFDHIESKDTELTAEALTTASPDYLGQAVKGMAGYGFCTNHPASTAVDKTVKWYAYYNLNLVDDAEKDAIKKKLAERAPKVGLLGCATISSNSPSTKITSIYNGNTNTNYVLLEVR